MRPIASIFMVALLCVLMPVSPGLGSVADSDDQMAINLHVIADTDKITLRWDDVYPDCWYIPERETYDDEFYPLVDIPIRDSTFEYSASISGCFRIRVVDKSFNEVAVSKEKVCVNDYPFNPYPPVMYDVAEDGDCRCILMMCYQIGKKHAHAVMCEEEQYLHEKKGLADLSDGNLPKDLTGGSIRFEPIIMNGRVYCEPRDVLEFIPNSKWEWDQDKMMLTMQFPKVMYAYRDDTEPYHYTTIEMKVGKNSCWVDDVNWSIDPINRDTVSFIQKDEDGIGHLMVPLRFMAKVTGARDIVWLPEHKIPIITYDVNDCGCQMEGRNNLDPCVYDNWDIEITNVVVNDQPADSSLFSTDGTIPEKKIGSSGFFSFDFSVINNNECPITYVINEPFIWVSPRLENADINNLEPITLKPGERSESMTVSFRTYEKIDKIIEILRFTLVYQEDEYIEKENTTKTIIAKTGSCCRMLRYDLHMNNINDTRWPCFYAGQEAVGSLKIENLCYDPIWVKLIPTEEIEEHSIPDDIFELNSDPHTYTEIPFSLTVPDNDDGSKSFSFCKVIQVYEDGKPIEDCEEKEIRLPYCTE